MNEDIKPSASWENKGMLRPQFGLLPGLLGFQLRRAQLQIYSHFKKWFGSDDPNANQFAMLVLIDQNPDLSQIDLSKLMGVERATIGEALARMEARGWIVRAASAEDRRSNVMSVSAAGRRIMETMLPRIAAQEVDFANHLQPEERQTLMALLCKLTRSSNF